MERKTNRQNSQMIKYVQSENVTPPVASPWKNLLLNMASQLDMFPSLLAVRRGGMWHETNDQADLQVPRREMEPCKVDHLLFPETQTLLRALLRFSGRLFQQSTDGA